MTVPYLLEFLAARGTLKAHWVLVRSVPTMEEGLRVASNMSSAYQYRLYCGPDSGYYNLEWQDDPTDPDLCVPAWVPSK